MGKRGQLVVISGPSGAGKGTVLARAIAKDANLRYSVSVTTRAPRCGEKDGVNYYFIDRSRYDSMLAAGEFLEHQEVYGNFYGTPRRAVTERLDEGLDVVLEIDVKGALDIKNHFPAAVMVFLTPPDREELEKRLRGRSTETEEQLRVRIAAALEEIKQAALYDYILVNDDAERCAEEIIAIVRAQKCKVVNNKEFLDNLIYGGNNL